MVKRAEQEPKIYALMLKSSRSEALHIGVYYNLEEAYAEGRKRLTDSVEHLPNESIDIDLWNILTVDHVLNKFMGIENLEQSEPMVISNINKSTQGAALIGDPIKNLEDAKNQLTKKLIDEKNIAEVEKLKPVLGNNLYRYILDSINREKPSKKKKNNT